ncbi:MAG TPA: L-histidine N(alpha)-methyltransferase [Dehalococcoidia bacterium]|nr:L-histidine N(alpha)-methyltransferase [Dehalococcoidia bacterium]
MKESIIKNIRIFDFQPQPEDFLGEVLRGLKKVPKQLPTKYLYDERGSTLYERICTLDEYYLPRVEIDIMERNIDEIANLLGKNVSLVEYGCGSCTKTRILLDHMPDLTAYIPIDISREQLLHESQELNIAYPELEILPVCADFTGDFQLPVPERNSERNVAYFPGSSIGNFGPDSARNLLTHIADLCKPGGALLISIDLAKDPEMLHYAYNDRDGVTAAFNLNLLERINHELGGDFNLSWFRHHAFYNIEKGRVEMHLVSLRDQVVHINNTRISFAEGESIWTESSYKYELRDFMLIADDAGFKVEKVWIDDKEWFSVLYLVVDG